MPTPLPRPEYPRPQFTRDRWLCLNGAWQFEIDACDSGLERGLLDRNLAGKITVPFCPESKLSGVEHVDFMLAVWYRRVVRIPAKWQGQRLLLHFQAVDYDATVWCNGQEVGRHRGGFTGFTCDLTDAVGDSGAATIVVRARDDWRPPQARGKQSQKFENHGCLYTRTTGIWQTVWLEPVARRAHLERPRITPDCAAGRFVLQLPIRGDRAGLTVHATLRDDAGEVAAAAAPAAADFTPTLTLAIPADRRRAWSIDDPHLYTLQLALRDDAGETVDEAASYAGLRSVTIDGMAVKLNGKPVFQRLVLDQGYYPDGLMTAPSDAALKEDIEIARAAGFNGARLHQKVFEERFLYWCDKLGYLVWGEFGDWGCNTNSPASRSNQQPDASYLTQWLEALERDYNHPAIVGWCPLNETYQKLDDRIATLDAVTRGLFLATKAFDQTRPVLDTSGYAHREPRTDVYDSHDYEQDPARFKANQAGLAQGKPFTNPHGGKESWSIPYAGQPYFVSEFGGIWWNPDVKPGEASWGYGNRPRSEKEFYQRFDGLCRALLDDPNMFGYCYTQLTDVFQEQNGVVRFDRSRKLDLAKLRKSQQRPAAIEQR